MISKSIAFNLNAAESQSLRLVARRITSSLKTEARCQASAQ